MTIHVFLVVGPPINVVWYRASCARAHCAHWNPALKVVYNHKQNQNINRWAQKYPTADKSYKTCEQSAYGW